GHWVGGSGFLGRRLVRHLQDASFPLRIPLPHPDRAVMSFPDAGPQLRSVHGDINEDKSVTAAIDGAFAVVNAVSLYAERGRDTFQSVHVNAAERVAGLARQTGVERFLHFSGIGVQSRSI